ncbi:hypothetical protein BLNAU_15710 [Blattamonas nauphoetae]|uniref:Uncharacterized protein n=1 Tax=Blattamonas nauphoetae TaxID=2049346 RepID=A0ABQ9XGM9_9EUKA|nr:hypothetical protein BLNAU_15710 [Blattamonas nauphoetae]
MTRLTFVEFGTTRDITLVSPPISTTSFRKIGVHHCVFMKHIILLSQRNDSLTSHRNKSLRIANQGDYVLVDHQDSIHCAFLVGLVPDFCDKAETDNGIVVDA